MSRPAKGGYNRIVVFGRRTGWVADIGGHQALRAGTPSSVEELFNTGEGTNRVIGRGQTFEVPLIHLDLIDHIGTMQGVACEVGLIAFGFKRHRVWLAYSLLEIEEASGGFAAFASRVMRLNQGSVFPAISGSDNLLAFAPWICTDAVLLNPGAIVCATGSGSGSGSGGGSGAGGGSTYGGEAYYLTTNEIASGFNGPLWQTTEGASVNALGSLQIAPSAFIEFIFPMGGATVRLESAGIVGTVKALGGTGNTLATASQGSSLVIPAGTWKLRLDITLATAVPFLTLLNHGRVLPPRHGVCLDCEAFPLLFAEDPTTNWQLAPYIICPEKTCYSLPNNTAPYLVDDADVCLVEEGDGFARFSLELRDNECDDITISLVDVYSFVTPLLGDPYKQRPAPGVVNWYEDPLDLSNCTGGGSGSGSGGGSSYSSKMIHFEIAIAGSLCSGAPILLGDDFYTVEIEFTDGFHSVTETVIVRCPGDAACAGSGSGSGS